MKISGIFFFFLLFVLFPGSFSVQRPERTFNAGSGVFAGMTGIKADMTFTGTSAGINDAAVILLFN
jgi:hypothetical protein